MAAVVDKDLAAELLAELVGAADVARGNSGTRIVVAAVSTESW